MATVRDAVSAVPDPELPMVTIEDLGILRGVEVSETGRVIVTITPTYSGCPAMDAIRVDIRRALERVGRGDVEVRTELFPAWTTDWISDAGARKLAAAGIAPPGPAPAAGPVSVTLASRGPARCPRCGSTDTEELSRYGSTACKALWRCRACAEPFDHFKSH
ncbi:MAG: 1,2-phenylacetyl-CoA epoxidase subunit PaaD [Micromonosporaceae bacterium]